MGLDLEAWCGEELQARDPAEVPPVVAVRGVDETGVVGPEVFPGQKTRAVREDDVVFGQAVLRRGRGRNDEDAAGPELQEKNRTVPV